MILIGLFVGLMLLAGVPGWRKWPVAPAYAIPNFLLICIGLAALFAVSTVLEQLLMVTVMSSLSLVASAAYRLLLVEFDRWYSIFVLVIKLLLYFSVAPPCHAPVGDQHCC